MRKKDPKDFLVEVSEILAKLKIPYLVTGGMAVLVWGRPRFTADIDIVVELKLSDVDKLFFSLNKLSKAGYIDKDAMIEALNNFGEFNFIDGDTGIKVDFWVLKENDFDLSRLNRRIKKRVLNKQIYFSSPEDLILSKLQWYKKSLSSRHLEDVESILKISGEKLDLKYLSQWAKKMGNENLLEKCLKKDIEL